MSIQDNRLAPGYVLPMAKMQPVSRYVDRQEAACKAFQMNTTPRIAAARIVSNRIKTNAMSYFERQRRPQAHLDRVVRLGRA